MQLVLLERYVDRDMGKSPRAVVQGQNTHRDRFSRSTSYIRFYIMEAIFE